MTDVIIRCSVCNRPLTDPKSIRRGIGPICWGKMYGKRLVKRTLFNELCPKGLQEDNDYPTIGDYAVRIKDWKCGTCGFDLRKGEWDHFAHDGGWPLSGWKEFQWLYLHCPKCGIDRTLWKMGVPRHAQILVKDIKKEAVEALT